MPVKYKPSEVKIDRQTKVKSIQHYYMKQLSQEELFNMLNAENTKPKLKQKIRNELSRRGVRIVKSSKQAGAVSYTHLTLPTKWIV